MKILVVGSGGREHALVWKLSMSPTVDHIYVAPGNGGTATMPNVTNITDVLSTGYDGLVAKSKELGIGLVVVGPDDAVVGGIEEYFRGSGIACFAPSKEAAELEGSKAYAKDFMAKYKIPSAEYQSFSSYESARQYLDSVDNHCNLVIKADGLAAGKGVVLPKTREEAIAALDDMMLDGKFGDAGKSVVIEERMVGDEISILTFSDGKTHKSLPPGQDHKRIFEGNEGPNTGGMGVYAPVPFVTAQQMDEIDQTIIRPTFAGLISEDRPFIGLLFTGIMMTASGPKVLEYNVRFGDPETQTMMLLIESDLAEILLACTKGRLEEVGLRVADVSACNVVVSAAGYPGELRRGDKIRIDEHIEDVHIFHAGTKWAQGILSTNGGRVLSIAASAATLQEAISKAYDGIKAVNFDGMFYRRDIGARALGSTSSE